MRHHRLQRRRPAPGAIYLFYKPKWLLLLQMAAMLIRPYLNAKEKVRALGRAGAQME